MHAFSKHPCQPPHSRPTRVLLWTDTLGDINGVSRFIQNISAHALKHERDLHVFTSTRFATPNQPNIHNFTPRLAMRMPGYPQLDLAMPPAIRMLREARSLRPAVMHISTPGPVGLLGLIAARLLRVPVVGTYHTDFPAYIQHLFNDEILTDFARRAMRVFYGSFTTLFARSDEYIHSIQSLDFPPSRIRRLMPGIRIDQFHTRFRPCGDSPEPTAAPRNAATHSEPRFRALFVGRVSIEKNLPFLAEVWKRAEPRLREAGIPAELTIVGDGPFRETLQHALSAHNVHFLGFRTGDELSRIYASADLFLFPSTTDTLGQVVMEAQASGLPVLVSDQGGPKEIIQPGVTGEVISASHASDVEAWAHRIFDLAANPAKRRSMGTAAHDFMQSFDIAASFEDFWHAHELADTNRRASQSPIAHAKHCDEHASLASASLAAMCDCRSSPRDGHCSARAMSHAAPPGTRSGAV